MYFISDLVDFSIPDDIYIDGLRNAQYSSTIMLLFIIMFSFSVRYKKVDQLLIFTFFIIFCAILFARDVLEHYCECCIG